jgi:small subunit ribosomal protein S4e
MYLKRLTVPWAVKKKTHRYVVVPRGAHNIYKSVPLLVALRDMIGITEKGEEAKKIIKAGKVLVDGKICKDYKRGIGLFDVLSFPEAGKYYRLIIKKKPVFIEITEEDSKVKLCRIAGKTVLKSGKMQLNLHDGKNVLVTAGDYSVNDSVLLNVADRSIKDVVKFDSGCLIMMKSGEVHKIKSIERGFSKKILLEGDSETVFRDFIVVGTEKPIIKVNE